MERKAFDGTGVRRAGTVLALALFYLLYCGCFIFDNGRFNIIDVSGYVRSAVDSSAVPEVCVLVDIEFLKGKAPCIDTYTDSLGYFEFTGTYPTELYDAIQVELIAVDIDGTENGVFLSKDTLLIEDDLDASMTIVFETVLYVQMLNEQPKCLTVSFEKQNRFAAKRMVSSI